MLNKIIAGSFYLLFGLTPLIWTSVNFELFEYNKMIFTYLLATIIVTFWVIKMIREKTFLVKSTPLDIPLLLFLLANVISTVFSMDQHTSLWGYYSRSNGGLISLVAYVLLYYALVSNLDKFQVLRLLKVGIFGGVLVALWAIPEHFGHSPSCFLLAGDFNTNCWVQNVKERVFATLGQPNWLAAHMAMLIFPTFYFLLTSVKTHSLITYLLSLIVFYMAFTFTYSRGGTLGFIAGMAVFTLFLGRLYFYNIKEKVSFSTNSTKLLAGVVLGFLLVNIFFDSALTSFKLFSRFTSTARPAITLSAAPPSGTQLENGGNESGQIRLIVWEGALEAFKHYPLIGSGVETFAYVYYNFRPVGHNLTSEWDFLYNKAHNEYLNYLVTTGLFGFLSYMAIILTFIFWSIKGLVVRIKEGKEVKTLNTYYLILTTLAAYISYLVQNFFLFSVVIVALFFYLFPGIAFVLTDEIKPFKLPKLLNFLQVIPSLIYSHPSGNKRGKDKERE